jgi:hypothetical protein
MHMNLVWVIAIALAAYALFKLYVMPGSNPLLWALLLLPVVLLRFSPLGKGKNPLQIKSSALQRVGRQSREVLAYIVSVIAIIVPSWWLFSMATDPEAVAFPVFGFLVLVPIVVTGLLGLRGLLKQSQNSSSTGLSISQQGINGLILGVIGATILLLAVGHLSF